MTNEMEIFFQIFFIIAIFNFLMKFQTLNEKRKLCFENIMTIIVNSCCCGAVGIFVWFLLHKDGEINEIIKNNYGFGIDKRLSVWIALVISLFYKELIEWLKFKISKEKEKEK